MVNHERSDDDTSSSDEEHSEQELKTPEIIISDDSDTKTETNCASEESIEYTKNEEDEETSHNDMEVDKEKTDEEEEDDLYVLKDALEAAVTTSFQGLSQYQKNLMFQNLKNLGAETRKELTDGWKELNAEVLRLNAKKQTFFAKFANAGV
ncbi:PREDICTED: GLABROUS1 enhancer-binding protein-like 1 [Camelina sativa]|uniref:GLABROUS1 enhancer-binding protein-like 1 n=1 Tax=Camelina sativa TaxID=90675 RepID=A0ABM0U6W6_CAMSA|nr:PREDICTED: GLABROUS1 enhancer-binding protein-like 1 [Camelina sativa]